MKFCSIQDSYEWGEETFCLADLGYRESLVQKGWLAGNALGEIMDMYMDAVVGENVFEQWGRQFPVCIKKIHVSGRMPLRVHPSDEPARQRWDFLGKEKLWYVTSCGQGACVMAGFAKDTDATEVYEGCRDGKVRNILNVIPVHKGQAIYIPAGTPHCAWGDLDIIETAQSSPLDFCMCSWGQEVSDTEFDPALDFVDVMDLVNYSAFKEQQAPGGTALLEIEQFKVSRLEPASPLLVNSSGEDSFCIYSCISGSASVQMDIGPGKVDFKVSEGETILVPADCTDYALVPLERGTVIFETKKGNCK